MKKLYRKLVFIRSISIKIANRLQSKNIHSAFHNNKTLKIYILVNNKINDKVDIKNKLAEQL